MWSWGVSPGLFTDTLERTCALESWSINSNLNGLPIVVFYFKIEVRVLALLTLLMLEAKRGAVP